MHLPTRRGRAMHASCMASPSLQGMTMLLGLILKSGPDALIKLQSFTSDSQRAAHQIRSSYNHKSCSRGDRVLQLQPAAKKGSGAMAPVSEESSGRRHGELARGWEPSSSPCARRLLGGLVDHEKGPIDREPGATTERLCSETYGSISSMSPCPRCNTHRHTAHGHAHSFHRKRHFRAFRNLRLTGWIG
ncbi:hypothetical protein SETIT_7G250700v2 [Setaria italica]|uniref:Uncharacterized protein n=1 Tax=Setaria italica TaxID=4555 RepID=A0A368RZG2_SETIT|nr:hypothetical protein SETIT_7G250700v2 [Setaria italica]RCV35572.1 hypothetical protein SETIT_7G250700v2 [Setaria italica]